MGVERGFVHSLVIAHWYQARIDGAAGDVYVGRATEGYRRQAGYVYIGRAIYPHIPRAALLSVYHRGVGHVDVRSACDCHAPGDRGRPIDGDWIGAGVVNGNQGTGNRLALRRAETRGGNE